MNRLAAAALVIAAVACALRLPLLDVRPMHADEAILADKFGTLLEQGRFEYDPADYHGPVLEYLTLIPAALRAQWRYVELDEWTLRLVPAMAGVALALSPLLLAGVVGEVAAIASSALLAVSGPAVFYSRCYIPETLLTLLTALFLAFVLNRRWIAAGLVAGLAVATKETAVIAIFAAALAFLPRAWPGWLAAAKFGITLFAAPVLALGPGNLVRAAASYWARAGGAEWHAHPWHYYLGLLATGTPLVLALAIAGARRNWRLATWTAVVICIYSGIPYKTPWCVLSMLWGLAILAGIAVSALIRKRPAAVIAALALVCIVTASQDPWVYAQTGPDVYTIRDELQKFVRDENTPLSVYTTGNLWPLPWYLRRYPNVRWSCQVTIPGPAAPVVLLTPELEQPLTRKLYEGPPPGQRELYVPLFERYVEIRPGVEVRGYIAKSVYDAAQR